MLTGLTNALSGGETVKLQLDFPAPGAVTLRVPVEPDAYDYTTYSPPPTPTPTARPAQGHGVAIARLYRVGFSEPVALAVARRGAGTTARSARINLLICRTDRGIPVSGG